MQNILYLLVNKDKSLFKVGITNNLKSRHARLSAVWGKFDLASSCTVSGNKKEISGLEKTLHYLLGKWRFNPPAKAEGHSEWFSMECFDKAIEIISTVFMLRETGFGDKIVHGIAINQPREVKHKAKKEKYGLRTSNIEVLKTNWPIYEKFTIDFRQHPKDDRAWLWTINVSECRVSPADAMILGGSGKCVNINLCTSCYINDPSIIQLKLSKELFGDIQRDHDFKPFNDILSVGIRNLIEIGRRNAIPYECF